MHLASIRLSEFRQYRQLDLELPTRGLVIVGNNASGKSSLLEAIAMLATTRSPRTNLEREVVNWTSGQDLGLAPYARIEGEIRRSSGNLTIEIGLDLDPANSNRLRKIVSLGGKRVRSTTAVGAMKCVLFEPGDLELVTGPPSIRRRYLDIMLSQIDQVYLRSLSRYVRIVEQRNSLIKRLVESGELATSQGARTQLDFWDGELITHGSRIIARRLAATSRLSQLSRQRFASFDSGPSLSADYQPTFESTVSPAGAEAEALERPLAFEMSSALDRQRVSEFRRGMTLIGPHRDEIRIAIDGKHIASFGSRGQQRLAVVALKLAETDLIGEIAGEPAVVLLDDVYSELDERHRAQLSEAIGSLRSQTIVTSTDWRFVDFPGLEGLGKATVAHGQITVDGHTGLSS
jgi:DNA replication and repair protein RecF